MAPAVGAAMAPPTKSSIMTGSGRYFDPLSPTPESIHMPDVARGLRRGVACRFNGQLLDPAECPHPQSGASHSVRVGRLAYRRAIKTGVESTVDLLDITLAGLVHDSPEGYTGDRLGPLKTDADREMEEAILMAILLHLLPEDVAVMVREHVHGPIVVWADRVALRMEALIYQPGAYDWALPAAGEDRNVLAETLSLFHPREYEDWLTIVMAVVKLMLEIDDTEDHVILARLAKLMA